MKYLLVIMLFVWGCETPTESTSDEPTAQYHEFEVTYNGTAQSPWLERQKLFFLVDYGSYTPYDNFSFYTTTNGLRNTQLFRNPYKFEPGTYEISGCLDWNHDDSWDIRYEPKLLPVKFDVDGLTIGKTQVKLIDVVSPTAKGWFECSVFYKGTHTGRHHLYVTVQDQHGLISDYNEMVNRVSMLDHTICVHSEQIPAGEYTIVTVYWDIDDSGSYSRNIDPMAMFSGYLQLSPGLPFIFTTERELRN